MSLSYQHIYHAGNPADLHKHLWLVATLDYLLQKDKPVFWLDTHAGRGLYDLQSAEALKTNEAAIGIAKTPSDISAHPLWQKYMALIAKHNNQGEAARYYPGSALIAADMLRRGDHLHALELHPGEFAHLQTALGSYKGVTTEQRDMAEGLPALMPPVQKRGGALIDPSYEIKTEYETVPALLLETVKKFPTGTFLLWYPILPPARHEILKRTFENFGGNIIIDEWMFGAPADKDRPGLLGSGMVVINPPYTVPETVAALKDDLLPALAA